MYQVYCDGITLHDLRSEQLVLTSPVVNLGDNDAGSFEFTIAPTHPEYNSIRKLKSEIQVFHNGIEIFCGRPIEETKDFYDNKKIYCEGELNYLADSIQRPAEYHQMTVRGFLERLVTIHNEQVEESKQFKVGMVTVVDSNDSLYRYTNYESTLTCISDKLIKKLGGHIRVRKVDGVKYIDYLADYPNTNDQVIEFGKNLLDFSQNIDGSDIATAIIPLGGKLEESSIAALEERLTIASVNGGVDFIYNQTAVNNYGWIFKTVTFDDVNVPANLKREGEQYLEEIQFENLVLSCTAVDLNNLDVDIERIKILDRVRVVSEQHGLDRFFPVTKLTINLEQPESDKITLGSEDDTKTSLTGSSASNNSDIMDKIQSIPSEADILKEAQDNATELIKNATHGHVVTEPDELLIMDTNNKESAGRLWRWNLNGLGYSSTGYNGRYTTAITMDGQIVGERLIGGSVTAEKLAVEYRSSVEKAIQLAEDNANDATDQKLKSYYTKVQVTTEIKNSADSVLISAKEEAVEYTDNRLKNYSTSAEIKVKTDAIESTVSKKLNTSDFTTKLTQSYSYVRIAWNNCSKYIQFEGSALNIYDSSDHKLMSLTHSGNWFYREGSTIGMIGTSNWSGDSSYKGLVFDLENTASYMCWAAKDSNNATFYTVKLIYHHKTSKAKQGLHLSCNTYANGCLYLTDSDRFLKWSSGGSGFNGALSFVNKSNSRSVEIDGVSKSFKIYNNVTIDIYSDIDMHGWSIKNQSDARMKKNINPTQVNALKLLNSIDLKEYDWVRSGEHEPIGIIAQQLQLFAPELVEEEKDGHLSIKTTKFIFYLIKAIQELSGEGYIKPEWSDPYTLQEKLEFCSKLDRETKDSDEEVHEPIQLPIRK